MGFGATPTVGKSMKNFMSFNWKKKVPSAKTLNHKVK
jgi:hypothetical protein